MTSFSIMQLVAAWLSGSGGAGETHNQLWHILANRTCAERRRRYPTGAGIRQPTRNVQLDCHKNDIIANMIYFYTQLNL
jgi:hypothetical protein